MEQPSSASQMAPAENFQVPAAVEAPSQSSSNLGLKLSEYELKKYTGPSVVLLLSSGLSFAVALFALLNEGAYSAEQHYLIALVTASLSLRALFLFAGALPQRLSFSYQGAGLGIYRAILGGVYAALLFVASFAPDISELVFASFVLSSVTALLLATDALFSRIDSALYPLRSFFSGPVDKGVLYPGDRILADGVLEHGELLVRERRISPVPKLRWRREGEDVFAGSEVLAGKARYRPVSALAASDFSMLLESFPFFDIGERPWIKEGVLGFSFLLACVLMHRFTTMAPVPVLLESLLFVSAVAVLLRVAFLLLRAPRAQREAAFLRGVLFQTEAGMKRLAEASELEVLVRKSSRLTAVELERLEILDPNVDDSSLRVCLSKLVAELGVDSEPLLSELADVSEQLGEDHGPSLEIINRSVEGVTAVGVGNEVPFQLGTEMYMLESGVFLEPSICAPVEEADAHLYLAVAGKVLAKLVLVRRIPESLPDVLAAIRKSGVTLRLRTEVEEDAALDELGKEAGFELAEIRRGISTEEELTAKRLRYAFGQVNTAGDIESFDPRSFDLRAAEMIDFHSSPAPLCSELLRAKSFFRAYTAVLASFALLGPLLLLGAFGVVSTFSLPGLLALLCFLPLSLIFLRRCY